jgi:hypothetical protein
MNGFTRAGAAIGLLATAAVLAACGGSNATGNSAKTARAAQSATAGTSAAPEVPAKLKVPDGHELVSTMDASGVQAYQCDAGAWKLLEPAATLSVNGRTTALHSRGPVWISTVDGSAVNATAVPGATEARPNAVPELLLKATATRGTGTFGRISYVQRLRTEGGVAPTGSCTGAEQKAVPYTAVYTFYAPVR